MAKRIQMPVDNNLDLLLHKNSLEDNDLAEFLNVDSSTIRKYKNYETNLPIDLGVKLADKYEYSLDWIYRRENNNSKNFMIDIRELITCDENNIYISLSSKHMKYINDMFEVKNMDEKESIKYHEQSKITNHHINSEDDGIICKAEIPKDEFFDYIDDVPYSTSKNTDISKRKSTEKEKRDYTNIIEASSQNTKRKKINIKGKSITFFISNE